MANTINVTACDNELIILAYQATGSFELCRILSGNLNPINVTININEGSYQGTQVINGINVPIPPTSFTTTLPAGSYNLLLLGIDWGTTSIFTVNVNGTNYNYPQTTTKGLGGLVWNAGPIAITV